MLKRWLLIPAVLLAAGANAMELDRGPPPPPAAVLAHELELTDDQEDRLREILATHRERRQLAQTSRREAHDQLFAQLREILSTEQFADFLAIHERRRANAPGRTPRRR